MSVVVIGAGQAGLSVSRELTALGVDHVVLERARVAQAWRERWDSFTLVTPNWTLDLPGSPYSGDDPEGHVHCDEIVAYLEEYAATFAVPVREGVHVQRLRPADGHFELVTSEGRLNAATVVVCTGAYQRPYRPQAAAVPPGVLTMTSTDYRNPDQILGRAAARSAIAACRPISRRRMRPTRRGRRRSGQGFRGCPTGVPAAAPPTIARCGSAGRARHGRRLPFNPMARASRETRYQFRKPFVLDSTAATEAFGIHPAPPDDALHETIADRRSRS